MTIVDRWILPDGIEEILPPEAGRIEHLRREILDEFKLWGYELVIPPMAEFLESLLTGVGHDLDLLTFKLTDQLSGRTMGLSADNTQQVARMDAHSIQQEGTARYCYCSPVLHTKPASLHSGRSPIQIGAELYGFRGLNSDVEIVNLMLTVLSRLGVKNITLDLGHVSIYRAVADSIGLPDHLELQLYDLLRRKALPELDEFLTAQVAQYPELNRIAALAPLSGSRTVLEKAEELFADLGDAVTNALNRLNTIADSVAENFPEVNLHFDLSELKDYNYHTGLVFSAFVPGLGQALAKGGRYDATGEVFGRARPATGFSTDLKALAKLTQLNGQSDTTVFAPASTPMAVMAAQRAKGIPVVQGLSGDDTASSLGCNHQLVEQGGQWQVVALEN